MIKCNKGKIKVIISFDNEDTSLKHEKLTLFIQVEWMTNLYRSFSKYGATCYWKNVYLEGVRNFQEFSLCHVY